jgi:hypothetical protein
MRILIDHCKMPLCKNTPTVFLRRIEYGNKVIWAACRTCWEDMYSKSYFIKRMNCCTKDRIYEEVSQEDLIILQVMNS